MCCFDRWRHGLDFGKVKQVHQEDGAVVLNGPHKVRHTQRCKMIELTYIKAHVIDLEDYDDPCMRACMEKQPVQERSAR